MHRIHFKDMIAGRQQDFGFVSEDHRLQDIDRLGDICHADAVTMFVEDVESRRRHDSISN